jgi:hypothetical protein
VLTGSTNLEGFGWLSCAHKVECRILSHEEATGLQMATWGANETIYKFGFRRMNHALAPFNDGSRHNLAQDASNIKSF